MGSNFISFFKSCTFFLKFQVHLFSLFSSILFWILSYSHITFGIQYNHYHYIFVVHTLCEEYVYRNFFLKFVFVCPMANVLEVIVCILKIQTEVRLLLLSSQ